MWFHLGCHNFIGKIILKNEFCDIFVSDFVRIWHKTLSNNELMSISQQLNPLLEASVQKLRDITLDCFKNMKTQKDIKEENSKIILKIESDILGLKFLFQVSLNQGDSKMFFEEFTFPLLILLKNFQNHGNQLMDIIKEKDEVLAEHNKECGLIKSCFSTVRPFIKKEVCGHESEKIPWDITSFLDSINFLTTEKLGEVKKVEIEKEQEKSSQIKKFDRMQSVSKSNNRTVKKCSKPCVTLDNQIVKKRQKNALKLSF